MGTRIGDLISSFSSPSACENKLLKDVLDQRLPPPTPEHSQPQSMSTMHMVSQSLSFQIVASNEGPDITLEQFIKI
ncbi:LRR receptor-like serine/threonine-protein kinase [Pyrus ussuriensis x Pyrus communis]|uniref:LRR receptor-like serine/threonine-protein kinase n=1 Tax=Pyrus ussuriensis x Pyrus communis TaxID=2448454 RepID=A0A5N5GJL2_9ROSA|nr:LRR receptor-like serine/threonine-protein kinase [Pyrus ussuriensis x Pyrus communis]